MRKFNKDEYNKNLRIKLDTMKAYVPEKTKKFKFVSMNEFDSNDTNEGTGLTFNIIYFLFFVIGIGLMFYSLYLKIHDNVKDSIVFKYTFFACLFIAFVCFIKDYKIRYNIFLWLNPFIWVFNSIVWFFNAHF